MTSKERRLVKKHSTHPTVTNDIAGSLILPNVSNVHAFARKDTNIHNIFTAGSIPFIDANLKLAQDNSNLFWDDTNKRLGIGTNTPAAVLDVAHGGTETAINVIQSGILASNKFGLQIYSNTNQVNEALVNFTIDNAANFRPVNSITNKGTGNGIYINQDGNGIALNIDSESSLAAVPGLKVDTAGGDAAHLTGGNVGIETATPTLPLDVNAKSGNSLIGGFCIKLTNKTGANSVQGETVKTDAGNDDSVVLCATADDDIIGVFLEAGVADGAEAWIVVSGIADVLADTAGFTRGDRLVTSLAAATVARATANNAPAVAVHFQEIGHALETAAANTLGRCVLHFN